MNLTRRAWFPVAGAAVTAACTAKPDRVATPPGNSPVAILKAPNYSVDLLERLTAGAKELGLDARGKRVLLKPNLVEFDRSTSINTDVRVLAAAFELFTRLGASEVRIGEGPGHRRDTLYLAGEAGYRRDIASFESKFVDLNRDDVSAVKKFADLPEILLPDTVLGADLIVSVAKMKTHHWAGATLSMKNFFGLVPGAIYGWPKNQLHHVGIARSIFELNRIFAPKSFAIVDGIVGMEGNGPIQGKPKPAGVLVMGRDLAAVDATCCRIMGINPEKLEYLEMARALGQTDENRIEQRGEAIAQVRTSFELLEAFHNARLG